MKKTIILLLLLGLILVLLVGCGGEEGEESKWKILETENSEMFTELFRFLEYRNSSLTIVYPTFEEHINSIREGTQALHVEIDPESQYYVCGYYNPEHTYEETTYCCKEKYTWLRYESPLDIQESFEGKELIVAFQLNPSSFLDDLASEENTSTEFWHFSVFETEFKDGLNINPALVLKDSFIYLNERNKSEIYYTTDMEVYSASAIRTVAVDGEYCIIYPKYTLMADGEKSMILEGTLDWYFGEYYDALSAITLPKDYVIPLIDGAEDHYGLIPVNDFKNEIFNKE